MNKICIFVGMTIGSYAGWWLGDQFGGFMTAFIVSSIGSIAGVYLGWKINREFIE